MSKDDAYDMLETALLDADMKPSERRVVGEFKRVCALVPKAPSKKEPPCFISWPDKATFYEVLTLYNFTPIKASKDSGVPYFYIAICSRRGEREKPSIL